VKNVGRTLLEALINGSLRLLFDFNDRFIVFAALGSLNTC
jgi:hypothetical protein